VFHDDLNDLQDCVIGNKHPTLTLSLPAAALVGAGITLTGSLASYSGAGARFVPLPIIEAKRITGVRVFVQDSATGPTKLQATLSRLDMIGGATSVASSAASSGAGTNQTLAIAATETATAGHSYVLSLGFSTGSALVNFYGVEVDYDKLV
jgi:hypothetical protein